MKITLSLLLIASLSPALVAADQNTVPYTVSFINSSNQATTVKLEAAAGSTLADISATPNIAPTGSLLHPDDVQVVTVNPININGTPTLEGSIDLTFTSPITCPDGQKASYTIAYEFRLTAEEAQNFKSTWNIGDIPKYANGLTVETEQDCPLQR
jgi:hypothetical protein